MFLLQVSISNNGISGPPSLIAHIQHTHSSEPDIISSNQTQTACLNQRWAYDNFLPVILSASLMQNLGVPQDLYSFLISLWNDLADPYSMVWD